MFNKLPSDNEIKRLTQFQSNWIFNNLIEDARLEENMIEDMKNGDKNPNMKEYSTKEGKTSFINRIKDMRNASRG